MSFFESEMVRKNLQDIEDLQDEVFGNVIQFQSASRAEQLDHIESLEELLNKQQVLYFRLQHSEDPHAKRMLEKIKEGAIEFGFAKDTDIGYVFRNMMQMVSKMREHLAPG
tara:strand:+ start:2817 stop:3149 length:333 start_codon:yes stop_codon:yes gene_type:complete